MIKSYYRADFCQSRINHSNNAKQQVCFGALEKDDLIVNDSELSEKKQKKQLSFPFLCGIIATIGQVVGGVSMMAAAIIDAVPAPSPPKVVTIDYAQPAQVQIFKQNKNSEKICINPSVNLFPDSVTQNTKIYPEKFSKKEVTNDVEKNEQKARSNFKEFSALLKKLGWSSLGISYMASVPSCVGASIKEKQPSMLLSSLSWGALSPIMMFDSSINLRGALLVSYALFYSGFANKIKNEYELKEGEKPRTFDLDFLKDKKVWGNAIKSKKEAAELGQKLCDMGKFVVQDQVMVLGSTTKSCKQILDKVIGNRKELPDFVTTKPSADNRKITSMLSYAGGIPLMMFGGSVEALTPIANALAGTGMFADAIGMFTIGSAQKNSSKQALLIGIPIRVLGDFAQTNDFMYGLRTLGGASCEYYFTMLNKDAETNKES